MSTTVEYLPARASEYVAAVADEYSSVGELAAVYTAMLMDAAHMVAFSEDAAMVAAEITAGTLRGLADDLDAAAEAPAADQPALLGELAVRVRELRTFVGELGEQAGCAVAAVAVPLEELHGELVDTLAGQLHLGGAA